MTTDVRPSRRIGIPIEHERKDGYCEMSIQQFEAFSSARINTQRSLRAMGAQLGKPLYVNEGFHEFELRHPQPTRVPAPDPQEPETPGPNGCVEHVSPALSSRVPAVVDLPGSTRTEPPDVTAAAVMEGPLLAAAPGVVIDRLALDVHLRAGPSIMRLDGKLTPWATTALPKPVAKAAAQFRQVILERIGEETMLRTPQARYRAPDAAQARAIDVGTMARIEKGEEQRCLFAKGNAIRLHDDLFDPTNVDPENES